MVQSFLSYEEHAGVAGNAVVIAAAKYFFDKGVPVIRNIGDYEFHCFYGEDPLFAVLSMVFDSSNVSVVDKPIPADFCVHLLDLSEFPPEANAYDFLPEYFSELELCLIEPIFFMTGNKLKMGISYDTINWWELEEICRDLYLVLKTAKETKTRFAAKGGSR